MEQVGAVPVDLDSGLLFRFAVCVASDVMPAVDDNNLQAQLGGCLFCDRQAKKPDPTMTRSAVTKSPGSNMASPMVCIGCRSSLPEIARPIAAAHFRCSSAAAFST